MIKRVTTKEVQGWFSPRPRDSHKGDYGHLLLLGGSVTKLGAILMAGRSALRTGAGLVTVALPDQAFQKLPRKFLELMYEPLPSTTAGLLSRKGWRKLKILTNGKKGLAIGPGMGVSRDTVTLLSRILSEIELPLILDADALNGLAQIPPSVRKNLFSKRKRPVIVTPHPGEMARLVGTERAAVQKDRVGTAKAFAMEYGVTVVLKGFQTVTATPSGEIFINSTGNPGMATAGMGDVLTGMMSSLLVQGMAVHQAVVAAVFLHGRAGDRVAARLGDRGLLAGDLIEEIPMTLKELRKG